MSDVIRLKNELRTLWEAVQYDLEEDEPDLARRERREKARSMFLAIVDDAAREITSE